MKRILMAMIMAAAALVLPGDHAFAASSANCTINVAKPTYDSGARAIRGTAWQACTARVNQLVEVQVRRWTGEVWQVMNSGDSGWLYTQEIVRPIVYPCAGSGTHTYRVYARGNFYDDTGFYQSPWIPSLSLRTYC